MPFCLIGVHIKPKYILIWNQDKESCTKAVNNQNSRFAGAKSFIGAVWAQNVKLETFDTERKSMHKKNGIPRMAGEIECDKCLEQQWKSIQRKSAAWILNRGNYKLKMSSEKGEGKISKWI